MGHPLRVPCRWCESGSGVIRTRGGQDVVFCAACDRYQYCAPRVETGREVRSVVTVHAGITGKQRVRILMRDGARCYLCGARGDLHVGHLLSVKAGLDAGLTEVELNDDENLVAMCAECNLSLGRETVTPRLYLAILKARLAWKRASEGEGNDDVE